LVELQYERAKDIFSEHKEGHAELAQLLMEKEVIFVEDLERIFGKRKWISRADELMAEKDDSEKKKKEEITGEEV